MSVVNQDEQSIAIVPMLRTDVIGVIALGAGVGVLIWVLGSLLNQFIFDPYLCQNAAAAQCADAKNYSAVLAGLIVGAASLGGLIRLRVYRPLLVVIAAFVSLWGIVQLSWEMTTFTGLLVCVLLYALAFGLFTWIARVREFWIALLLTIGLVVLVRLALIA